MTDLGSLGGLSAATSINDQGLEGVDLVGEEMSDGGSEDARELGMQEMAEGALSYRV
jgi:hypothetical protein